MTKAARITATVASSLSLVAGFAGVVGASPASISHTGPDSSNRVHYSTRVNTTVRNDNDVNVTNNNPQTATSGDARAHENTDSGDVWTGAASNSSHLNASLSIDNSGSSQAALDNASNWGGNGGGDANIDHTGPDSTNSISSHTTVNTTVNNNNDVRITNNNSQRATSGDASASDNTTVGSVSTGDATNNSSTTLDLNFTN